MVTMMLLHLTPRCPRPIPFSIVARESHQSLFIWVQVCTTFPALSLFQIILILRETAQA